jgi:hypothetical protein
MSARLAQHRHMYHPEKKRTPEIRVLEHEIHVLNIEILSYFLIIAIAIIIIIIIIIGISESR